MSIESIESETMQQFVGESLFEEESKELWNGRSLSRQACYISLPTCPLQKDTSFS